MPSTVEQLDCIFKPSSMAIIGASDNIAKWGYMMVERPLRTGYQGKIHPVNPQGGKLLDLPCYRSVKDIPGPVELAVITVQAAHVPAVMQECVEKGIRGAILISAGFAETGSEGKALQERVMGIAADGGIRCVGPNCMGIWSAAACLNNAFEQAPRQGYITFISQSGTFGGYMADMAGTKGYGLRAFISIGNQADLSVADYIEYFSHDEETRVIILYLEGIKDGRRFFDVCRETVKRKPIILYKGGSSLAGARATMSHTASIAGSDLVFQSACEQLGLIRAEESFQTFDLAVAFLASPLPPGNRIGVLGTGGQGVVSTDACQKLGLEVPELDKLTCAALFKMLPAHAPPPTNPVDFAGSYRTAMDEANVVETLLKLKYIDGVISNVPINPFVWGLKLDNLPADVLDKLKKLTDEGTKRFCELPRIYGKPIVCVRWYSDIKADPVADALKDSGIPVYDTPEQCARAMAVMARYSRLRRSHAK